MNNVQRAAIFLLVVGLFTEAGHAQSKTYEAIIRLNGDSPHVLVEAKDYFDAKDRIKGLYCGVTDCIIEGPWERH